MPGEVVCANREAQVKSEWSARPQRAGHSRHVIGRAAKAAAAALLTMAGVAGTASAVTNPPPATEVNNQFFDWFVNTTPNYVPSPFLTNQSANAVNAFLMHRPAGAIRAVKVEVPISNATANLIFNNPNYHVSYVLGDLEMENADAKIATLARQTRFVNGVS